MILVATLACLAYCFIFLVQMVDCGCISQTTNIVNVCSDFMQEIVSIYPVLSPPNLSPAQSNRVCNALALLQVTVSYFLLANHVLFALQDRVSEIAIELII